MTDVPAPASALGAIADAAPDGHVVDVPTPSQPSRPPTADAPQGSKLGHAAPSRPYSQRKKPPRWSFSVTPPRCSGNAAGQWSMSQARSSSLVVMVTSVSVDGT